VLPPLRPAVFNLVEGTEVQEMQRKIDAYRVANTESIVRNEARRAEEMRARAAAGAEPGAPAPDRAGVSGTAAAFHGGEDAEPHHGMEYTASLPAGAVM
jgi:CDK-activating kinase assembly factor MAT1